MPQNGFANGQPDQPHRRPRRHRGGRRGGFAGGVAAPSAVVSDAVDPSAVAVENTALPADAPLEETEGYLLFEERGNMWLLRRTAISRDAVYVAPSLVTRYSLRPGDQISGLVGPQRASQHRYPGLVEIRTVNGVAAASLPRRRRFDELTPLHPDRMLRCETSPERLIGRMVDLFSPIGAGQRALIVSPPKAGKTTILKDIATAILQNESNAYVILCLVGERPEEVTDIKRSVPGEMHASSFDDDPATQIAVAELAGLRAERLAEMGKDVILVLDSLTRLARAYNLSVGNGRGSGRTLSGGMDPAAVAPSKKFFGRARNFEEGGSVTIIASVLVGTDSRLDDLIYEEFKGTGNMEMILSRELAERRVFPAIDIQKTGTRMEERIMTPEALQAAVRLRRMLANANGSATEQVLTQLAKAQTNADFIQRVQAIAEKS